ncbi:MAG TPA: amylo-alpha-1,6-glucosidase, partial [Chloroflexota bacterium]|nr:amylo-alpha-1,6-glucosidase [Chloroflexota bacterium]
DSARELLERSRWDTGAEAVDLAHTHVLTRLMDALVARNADAGGTALDRPATTILAGNQYFYDAWKRDENIALGFLLDIGEYDLAREVIRDTWRLQDPVTGRLPQRIRSGEELSYHSSDGTLWALQRLHQYWRATGDDVLLYEKLPLVRAFFARSVDGTREGLLPSGRADAGYLWETWMDTEHTPRDGFPVEIQMLWIAALRAFRPIVARADADLESRMETAEAAAWRSLERYNVRGLPADSLDADGQVRDLITPNPYFCFGLDLDLGPAIERRMREVGRRQLRGRQGIITLDPDDWRQVFGEEFLADRSRVRGRRMRSIGKFNYHRGVEWNWLAQFFVQAELKNGDADRAYRSYLARQVAAVLQAGGVGGISELFDLSGVRGPEFQAWSMAGFLHALHAFAGVRIGVPERRIDLEPQLPADWPHLSVRKWYGSVPFDLHVTRGEAQSITVTFPWEVPQDVSIGLALRIPAGHRLESIDVAMDGVPQSPAWTVSGAEGTSGERAHVLLPASGAIEVRARMTLASKAKRVV